MTTYRLFGAETSPYSRKVESCLKFKGVDFETVSRSRANEEEFKSYAKVASVPLLVSGDKALGQDSTVLLATLEKQHPKPTILPDDPTLLSLALILEDYADEWLNKCMFQQRWSKSPDRQQAARRVLAQLYDGKPPRTRKAMQEQIASRMLERLSLVGADSENWNTLETSYRRFALRLNTHLKEHLFIFGGQPTVADFALAAQFDQMMQDPSPSTWMKDHAPFVVSWCEMMADPKASGGFASYEDLKPTLLPIFEGEVAKTYLPWAAANAASASREKSKFSVTLVDGLFEQKTQRYAGRAFDSVRKNVKSHLENETLAEFLEECGAARFFQTK